MLREVVVLGRKPHSLGPELPRLVLGAGFCCIVLVSWRNGGTEAHTRPAASNTLTSLLYVEQFLLLKHVKQNAP